MNPDPRNTHIWDVRAAYRTDSAHSLEGDKEGMARLVAEGSGSSGVDEGSGGAVAMASYCANEDCKGDVGHMEEDVCHQPATHQHPLLL